MRVLISVTASAPADAADAGHLDEPVGVGRLSFAHRGRPQTSVAATTAAVAWVMREQVRAAVQVRTRQVDLDRHHLVAAARQRLGGTRA